MAVMGAGNRDPERFPDPDQLELARADNRHLAFGWAAHFCFGAPLARIEGQIAFSSLLRRLPNLQLVPGPVTWRANLGLRGLDGAAGHVLIMSTLELKGMSPTKRALLEQRLRGGAAGPLTTSEPVSRRNGSGPAPLSIVLEQVWYFSRLEPDNPVYNEAVSIRKEGQFDVTAFRAAFNEIVRRHEIWRSTFEVLDGEPVQVVHPAPTWELPVVDLSAMRAAECEAEAVRMAGEEARRPYDLARGPLLRPLLIRFAEHHHRLYLALPHLLFDGVSLYRIILPELVTLYDRFRAGEEPSLPEPPIQYADYSTLSREHGAGPDFARRIDYWRWCLDGASTLQLPLDHPRPSRRRFRGAVKRMRISKELADGLRSLSRASGATLFQVLTAAFTVLLHRYSGQEDIVFGTISDLRNRRELEQMVGYCLTPLVVRVDVQEDLSFIELLGRVRGELLEGLSHLVPFERLVRELQPSRDPSLNPIFQAMLILEPAMAAVDPDWSLHQMEAEVSNAIGNAKLDLTLELDERLEGHLDGRLIYNTDLFDAGTIERLGQHFLRLLSEIIADPDCPIDELPWLEERERSELLEGWNETEARIPNRRLEQIIAEQAARTPDRVAVVFGSTSLTYSELDARSTRLASKLQALGVASGELVGICLERSERLLVALLGVLKAGGAYVPIDPTFPAERRAVHARRRGRARARDRGKPGGRPAVAQCSRAVPRSRAARERLRAPASTERRRERSRLRHLHLGLERPAQGGRDHAPLGGQSSSRTCVSVPGSAPTTCSPTSPLRPSICLSPTGICRSAPGRAWSLSPARPPSMASIWATGLPALAPPSCRPRRRLGSYSSMLGGRAIPR